MNQPSASSRVAIVGAGLSAAACAHSLLETGAVVTVFEKSRGTGGRMATRRAPWIDADGADQVAEFDHGAQFISARHGRFRAALKRAQTAGVVAPWNLRVHAAWPAPILRERFVATPQMPALCRHWLQGSTVHLQTTVQRLQRQDGLWQVVDSAGNTHGPYDRVVLAMPPAQAAVLLAGHRDDWADTLVSTPMLPCWTLMAVTDDVDWPWDACEPSRGPLAWVVRNDRKPGRSAPAGCATWVAQANAAWSQSHLDEDPQSVADALRDALKRLLPSNQNVRWHHSTVQRWRYAVPAPHSADPALCWWDEGLGLGVCGDFLAGGNLEAAWRSGDELADAMALLEATADTAAGVPAVMAEGLPAALVSRSPAGALMAAPLPKTSQTASRRQPQPA